MRGRPHGTQPSELEKVLDGLGYSSPYLIDAERGHVWTHGLGEQRRYPIQHTLRYQIWELDQPHYLHAHGRSLTGHGPVGEEHEHLASIRERFTTATRFDEDD